MDVTTLLIILLVGALATYFSGDKWAPKVALFFGLAAFAGSICLLSQYNLGQEINYAKLWIAKPNISFALQADGLALAMLLLTTALTPIIIYSSFGNDYKNSKAFYALILFMTFAMAGTFLASDGLLYYIFWELSLIPIYFIALIWGNGDAEERKKAVVKFFIYTLAGSLFMLLAFVYLYQIAGSFLISDLAKLKLSETEQFWIFLAFFLAYAIKIPLIPFHTWQAKVYQKAPTIGTMLLSGIMLKMGLYSVIRWQLPIAPLAAKEYMNVFIGLGIAGVIYGSIVALRQKDLKKLQNKYENQFVNSNSTIEGVAENLSTYYLLYGDINLINTEIDIYRSITREEIRTIAKKYLNPNQRLLLNYIPLKDKAQN